MSAVTIALVISIITLIMNIGTLLGIFVRIVRWIDRQKEQDEELAAIRHEQSIITVGLLVSLKNSVGEKDENETRAAIKLIEDHLNDQAHK